MKSLIRKLKSYFPTLYPTYTISLCKKCGGIKNLGLVSNVHRDIKYIMTVDQYVYNCEIKIVKEKELDTYNYCKCNY